jgi:tricorn protease
MPQWKDVSNRATALALSPTGKRAAVEARGEIFTIPAEKGDARDLTNSSASAERDPAWSPDGRFVSYFSDRSGEYKLYIENQDGITAPREINLPEPSHYYTPSWAPDGKHLVFTDTKLRVWVMDVASGQAKSVGNDEFMIPERSLNPVWSPDGQWLAYAKRLPSMYRAIFAYNVNTGETKQMTDGLADANWAAWDASGKYLWFLASTNFALNTAWLDMSSYDRPQTRALYLAVLRKTDPSPVLPESDEETVKLAGDTTRPSRGDTTAPRGDRAPRAAAVQIDFDGLQQRIIAIPGIAQRNYTQLRAGSSGTVFFVEPLPATGTQEPTPAGGFAGGPRGELHRYQLKDRKAMPFAQNVAQYVVSGDGHKLLYRTSGPQGGLYLVDADHAAPTAGQGRLATQLRAYVDPKAEFKQMFDEGWRNQRDYLYVPNMHGSDWPRMKQMYGQLLPYVMHREDLNYLLDMMGAEIAIGHSFVRGGDLPEVPRSVVGQLGADFTIENSRYKITKIYDAESWNPELRAPLAGPGIDVHVGDYVMAVNGVELRAPDNIYRLLDGTANEQTVLAVNSRPSLDGARHVTVVPVASEAGLRSRAWIEHNRHVVDSLSHGQLAYVYLPNTAQPGYASFNRYYFAQQDRKGAILDERYNGGGSAADYIIDILGRDFDGYFNNPVGDRYPFTSPAAGIWGPKVMIVNEMAGSGGDLMPYMFQHRHIGPLVGKRTWGGLVGTWDTPPFVDGGAMIAPRGGFFDKEGHWAVENVGTSPDIDVENWPKDVIAGHDPQLERAVAEAMKMLQEHPVKRLTKEPTPPTWGKRGSVVP